MSHLTDRVIDEHSTPHDGTTATLSSQEEITILDEPSSTAPELRPLFSAGPWGVTAAVLAVLLAVADTSRVASATFTPKFFVVLVIGGAGLVPLLAKAAEPRAWVARAAVAFLAVALVSALASSAPIMGFFGLYGWGTGWLFWLGCAGAYGIGTRLRGKDLDWLMGGLVVAATLNAIVAFYQVVAKPTGALTLYNGTQADGLLGNPVHLEALLIGSIAIVTIRAVRRPFAWAPLLVLFGWALEITEERLAILVLVAMVVALGVRFRGRGLLTGGFTCAGFALGLPFGWGLSNRVASGTGGATFKLRFDVWRLGFEGVLRRPVLGYGPGQLIGAVTPHIEVSFARALGFGRLFTDAHDIVIEVLVTTGILGAITFLSWVGGSIVAARNSLVLFALGVFVVELVEPLNLGVTPLAFMALGAGTVVASRNGSTALTRSMPSAKAAGEPGEPGEPGEAGGPGQSGGPGEPDAPAPLSPLARLAVTLAVVGGLVLGSSMIIGDAAALNAPTYAYNLQQAQKANRFSPYWTEPALALENMYRYLSVVHHAHSAETANIESALMWAEVGTERDPYDPLLWSDVGRLNLQLGRTAAARTAFQRSLQAYPYEIVADQGLAQIYQQQGDWAAAIARWKSAITVAHYASAKRAYAAEIAADERHLH